MAIFIAQSQHVHVAPEIVRPLLLDADRQEEVLHLREVQEHRRLDDIDAKLPQSGVVEEERVLHRELAARVGLLHAGILDDIDLARRPARGDVADNGLEKDGVRAREPDEERRGDGQIVVLVERLVRDVPFRNRWRRRRREEREIVSDGRRCESRRGFVLGMR